MMQEVAARLSEFTMLSGAGVGLVGIVTAGVYDLVAAARRPRVNAAAQRLRRSAQPSVTVLVYTCNDAGTVTACLDALRRSRYRNYDLVVVDNASRDKTAQAVRRFMRQHPRSVSYFYAKRKPGSLREVLREAYKRSRKGELVVTLTASSRPPRTFLAAAAARFAAEPSLSGLSVNERMTAPLTIVDLAPETARAARHVFMKSLSLLRMRRGRVGLNGVYRGALIMSGERAHVRYEGSLQLPVTRYEPRTEIVPGRQVIRVLLAAILLFLMGSAMITAASLVSSAPLLIGWSLVAVGSVAAVWSDEGIRPMQKLQLSFAATLIYFLSFITLLGFLLGQMTKSASTLSKSAALYPPLRTRRRAIS